MPTKAKLRDRAAGSIPPPLVVRYRKADGTPLSLAGFTGFAKIESVPTVNVTLGAGTVSINAAAGEATYTWTQDDSQLPADYQMLVWVDDGTTQRYDSPLITYRVYDGPGPTPTF